MATETAPQPTLRILDLTGLPEAVITLVTTLVQQARERQAAGESHGLPAGTDPMSTARPRLSHEEFRKLLDQMASMSTSHVLPEDFSRADIYDDHD